MSSSTTYLDVIIFSGVKMSENNLCCVSDALLGMLAWDHYVCPLQVPPMGKPFAEVNTRVFPLTIPLAIEISVVLLRCMYLQGMSFD
jgi:hypothetical protein